MIRKHWREMLILNLMLIGLAMALAYSGHMDFAILRIRGMDKLLHALLFGGIGFWVRIGISEMGPTHKGVEIAVLAALCIAVALDEMIQIFSPQRTADLNDLAADLLGIFVFWTLAKPAAHLSEKKPENQGA